VLVVTVVPVVLGSGIRLFAASPGRHRLRLESARTFASGMVQLRYLLGETAGS
jgi:dihydrofolate reductase